MSMEELAAAISDGNIHSKVEVTEFTQATVSSDKLHKCTKLQLLFTLLLTFRQLLFTYSETRCSAAAIDCFTSQLVVHYLAESLT